MPSSFNSALIVAAAGVGAYAVVRTLARRSRWFDFNGKVALITGGSRGLGLILARQLVSRGARVAICARTERDLETASSDMRQRGGNVLASVCDIRDRQQVQRLAAQILEHWGTIDLLFNVAGVIEVGPLDSLAIDDFHEAMDINCFGVLHTVLAVLPEMRRRRWGRIVNVASIGGKQAVPHLLPYDMSKFALIGLSQGLRTELAKDGILVITVSPTLMRTGSPRNATFKGRHREEYAWFSLGGSLPLVSISADRAATQILQACQAGDVDVFITNLLNPAVWANRLAPALTTDVLALINRLLPSMGGIGRRKARGYESESAISPSWLTSLNDQAAARNNELGVRPAV
jgi:NAD(P)-dependent dehydrogenase (short-subunit alcohol dehydrogenase family)